MNDNKTDAREYVTTEDGRKIAMDILKAQMSRAIAMRQKNLLKNLPPEKKSIFYYKAYEILNEHTFRDKQEPIMQMGLSSYTFMREPVTIGNFQTTYGDLFTRIHYAINEAAGLIDLEKK